MKVRHKLLIIGISILIITGMSVYFFSEYQTGIIKKAYEQINIVSSISKKIIEARNAINRFQIDDIINEEYYKENKSENLREYKEIMAVLKEYEHDFFEIYKKEDKETLQSSFRSISGNLDRSFIALVEAYKILGHNDYGLEGKFSEVRHGFMDILEELENNKINAVLESLKVQEMKLVHRRSDKYRKKIKKVLAELNILAADQGLDVSSPAAEYAGYIDDYYSQLIRIGLSDIEGLRLNLKNKLIEAESFFLKIAEDSNKEMLTASKNKTVIGLIFILSGILISSTAFYLFSGTITKPLYFLSVVAEKTAAGDLSSYLDNNLIKRKDEIGILSDSFHKTVQNLKKAILQIKLSSENNIQIGEELKKNADKTSYSVEAVRDRMVSFTELFKTLDQNISRSNNASKHVINNVNTLGESIHGQAASVEEISSIIEEMSANLNSISNITSDKKKISDNLVQITKEGDSRVRETNLIIKEISDNTGKMKDLTELIKGIASQTNLLSMNAAIEAAHAGAAGKGFSVVAEEIRKLSEETSAGVKGITSYLNSIVEKIDQALVSSENSGNAFIKVNEGVSGSADAFRNIADMVTEASSGSDVMLKSILEINRVTNDVRISSDDIKDVLRGVGNDLNEIAELSTTGTLDIENALTSIREIDKNSKDVADLSRSNEKILEELTLLVEQFKLESRDEKEGNEKFYSCPEENDSENTEDISGPDENAAV